MSLALRLRLSLVLSALWLLGLSLWHDDNLETFLQRGALGAAAVFVAVYGAGWIMTSPEGSKASAGAPQWLVVTIGLVIAAIVVTVPKLLIR